MAWVRIARSGDGDGALEEFYDSMGVPFGTSPGSPYDEMSLNPHALIAFHELQRTLRYGASDLTRLQREMIATYVSALNRCLLWTLTHGRAVHALSRRSDLADKLMLADLAHAGLPAAESVLLRYAGKLTLHPYAVTPMDIADLHAVGFDDPAIVDIALHTSLFAAWTRIVDGLGGTVPSYLLEEAERLRLPQAWGATGTNGGEAGPGEYGGPPPRGGDDPSSGSGGGPRGGGERPAGGPRDDDDDDAGGRSSGLRPPPKVSPVGAG